MAGLRFTGAPLAKRTRLTIGRIELEAIPISHDAMDPVGYLATATCSGMRAAIMTDLGVVTSEVRAAVRHADVLVIESNHDEVMLREGPYPWNLKRRVASRHGHLSNVEAGALAGESVHRGLQSLVLAHLSETNNTPRVALETLGATIRKTRWRGRATAAPQHGIAGPFGDVSRVAGQLSLF
jgi:phosphoribosyl 1,2-cyclic phosphodiesterase